MEEQRKEVPIPTWKHNLKMVEIAKGNYKTHFISKNYLEKILLEYDLRAKANNEREKRKRRLQRIYEAHNSKELKYYVTLTLNQKKKDRYNVQALKNSLKKIFVRHGVDYYLYPELHKDGAIHFHGLINAPLEEFISSGVKDRYGNEVLNLLCWSKNYGFNSCVDLSKANPKDKRKVLHYAMKYSLKNGLKAWSNKRSNIKNKVINDTIALFGHNLVVIVQ